MTNDLFKSTGPSVKRGQSKQDYATPLDFIKVVEKRFGPIAFDLAASAENHKGGGYFTKEMDSLQQHWHELPGLLWLNPPFDNIAPWAKKCAEESVRGANILLLVPASIGSNWFREHVYEYGRIIALNGRIHFDPEKPTWPYPKDCILVHYPSQSIALEIWRWKE